MIEIYTDGGSRGNPGPAAIGVVVYKDGERIDAKSEFIGKNTNNQAEYKALLKGLDIGKNYSDKLKCYLDSELVVRQLNGEYRVKNEGLIKLWKKVKEGERRFELLEYVHVNRTNRGIQEADKLVNQCLNKSVT